METKMGKKIHITMGNGYPKDGSVRDMLSRKRLVSKGAYVVTQSRRVSQVLFGSGLYVAALLCAVGTGLLILYFIFFMLNSFGQGLIVSVATALIVSFLSIALFGLGAKILRELAVDNIKQAQELDPGVPLTRAIAADLPVPDTLVRASEEPMQAQEAVLLRAVTEGQERHEEQLVRASSRQD